MQSPTWQRLLRAMKDNSKHVGGAGNGLCEIYSKRPSTDDDDDDKLQPIY